ncbi:hypothetical protein EVAR_38429_1 [Eumeta japonica]|uniref:Histone-lysine N-methyltransferase SETMAR n=1 Tax=Eumeta variegata TaxID=151549 RepID=A0A4C1WYT3_EUMVA|nr:hypothetical protein EVAR_38429_1 [Eumeta japonica]
MCEDEKCIFFRRITNSVAEVSSIADRAEPSPRVRSERDYRGVSAGPGLPNGTDHPKAIVSVAQPIRMQPTAPILWWCNADTSDYHHSDVKNEHRSGRPFTDNVDAILKKVEKDRYISSYDIVETLRIDDKTVLTHLKKAGYTKKSILGSHTSALKEM